MITKQIIEKHGLKLEEFEKIKKLLKRDPNLLELGIFQQCGMNIVHINHHEYILKSYLQRKTSNTRSRRKRGSN